MLNKLKEADNVYKFKITLRKKYSIQMKQVLLKNYEPQSKQHTYTEQHKPSTNYST